MPSVVGGVVQDGRLVEVAGAGRDGGPHLQYRIGSITKTFTAVLVMQCRDAGLLDLDDTVASQLPEAGYGDSTLRSLLAHTSGMQSEPIGPWWERSPGTDVATLLARNDGSGRVLAAGEAFHYSNLGFALLGEIVARRRGATWRTLVEERLLAPLDMNETSYDALPGRHVQGYSVDHFGGTLAEEPHHDTGAMAPAGQYWSTLADLGRWLDFLATGHPDVLARSTLDEMAVPGAPGLDYGLGVRLLDHRVGHTGSMPGFRATAFVDRTTRRGVVGLANATTGVSPDELARNLDLGMAATSAPAPWVPSAGVPAEVAELLGLWFWGNSAHELRWQNRQLELRDLTDPDDAEAFDRIDGAWRGTRGYHLGETLHVHRDAHGRPARLECATFVFTRTPYPR